MSAPNSVFWVDEMVKVFDSCLPRAEDDIVKYKEFVLYMRAYLRGLRQSASVNQERLDNQKECYVCGNEKDNRPDGHSHTTVNIGSGDNNSTGGGGPI